MRRAVSGCQARQAADDVDVQARLGDVEADEVVGAAGREHRVGRREGHQAGFGHARGRAEQQLLGHAHLEVSLRELFGEDVHVGVLTEVGGQAHDPVVRPVPRPPGRARKEPGWCAGPGRRTTRSSPRCVVVLRFSCLPISCVAGGQLVAAGLPFVGVNAREVRFFSVFQQRHPAPDPGVAKQDRRCAGEGAPGGDVVEGG
jgi:hypothetical protein